MSGDGPNCHECGEPVSPTAPYCIHCRADLEPETQSARQTGQTAETDVRDEPSDRLLDRDGLLDDSLTLCVGLAGGALVGVLTGILLLFVTQSGWGLLAGGVAWLVATGYLSTRRAVGEAVRYACYAVALVLVLFPVISFSDATKGGDFAGRVFLFLVAELLFGVVALALVGMGHAAGNG